MLYCQTTRHTDLTTDDDCIYISIAIRNIISRGIQKNVKIHEVVADMIGIEYGHDIDNEIIDGVLSQEVERSWIGWILAACRLWMKVMPCLPHL